MGAKELTNAFLDVPQIKDLQLKFERHHSYHQGKWPVSFSVIEASYAYHRTQYAPIAGLTDSSWSLFVYPVPRNMRAAIRETLAQHGFGLIREWLIGHAKVSGREGNWRFEVVWNSESKELTLGTHDYVLPDISARKQSNKK